MKLLAVVNDLFFEAKIGEVARTLEIPIAFAKSPDALAKRLAEPGPPIGLAVVDMGARGIDGAEAIRTIRAAAAAAGKPDLPIVAFISHMQPADGKRAEEAGASVCYAKSQLVRELPDLVAKGCKGGGVETEGG